MEARDNEIKILVLGKEHLVKADYFEKLERDFAFANGLVKAPALFHENSYAGVNMRKNYVLSMKEKEQAVKSLSLITDKEKQKKMTAIYHFLLQAESDCIKYGACRVEENDNETFKDLLLGMRNFNDNYRRDLETYGIEYDRE